MEENQSMPDFLKDHATKEHEEITSALPTDSLEKLTVALERMVKLKEIHGKNKYTNARVWAEYTKYETTLMGLLKDNNLNSFDGETHKISITVKSSITVPKTDEAKQALFDWIEKHKGKDVLLAYQSINAASLNKFYNIEADLHFEETGETSFTMDGVGEPKGHEKLSLKKKK